MRAVNRATGGRVGALDPGTDNGGVLGPAEYDVGTAPTAADPINANFLACQAFLPSCTALTAADAASFASDLGNWTTFYIKYASASSIWQAAWYAQLDFWQSLVNGWGGKMRAACPSQALPPNFPSSAYVTTAADFAKLETWASDVASDIASQAGTTLVLVGVVAAVALGGVGLFYAWPWLRRG
jgi:hypothetical protein